MNYKIVILLIVIVAGIGLAIAAPLGPIPGFFIGGNPTPVPDSWGDTSSLHEIELKVPGSPPRVVTIWFIDHENDLYVMSAGESGWTSRLGDGGSVEMRVGDATYSLSALRVQDAVRPIVEAYIAKYQADYPSIVEGFPPVGENGDAFRVYRLGQ